MRTTYTTTTASFLVCLQTAVAALAVCLLYQHLLSGHAKEQVVLVAHESLQVVIDAWRTADYHARDRAPVVYLAAPRQALPSWQPALVSWSWARLLQERCFCVGGRRQAAAELHAVSPLRIPELAMPRVRYCGLHVVYA